MKQENEICSLEQSKALKQLGFHGKTYCFYARNEEEGTWLTSSAHGSCHDWNMREERDCPFMTVVCSAPMLWTAQKWLRDEKCIDIVSQVRCTDDYTVNPTVCDRDYNVEIAHNGEWWYDYSDTYFPTYEEALSKGIDLAINLLKQEKK